MMIFVCSKQSIFENIWNMRLEIYELEPARFLTSPGLVWKES